MYVNIVIKIMVCNIVMPVRFELLLLAENFKSYQMGDLVGPKVITLKM